VAPNRRGKHVILTLSRKHKGKFRTAATLRGTLTSHSRFTAEFEPPPAGKCRVVASYPGDRTHLAGRRTKTFGC
jgi:hypothetical protein